MNASQNHAALPVHSLTEFLRGSGEEEAVPGSFKQESERLLRIEVDGGVWLKPGAAVAYRGDLRFERLPTLKGRNLRDMIRRELVPLVRAVGRGRLYCAHHGWHLRILRLVDEALCVSTEEFLAFEETLEHEIFLVGKGIGLTAGGLFGIRFAGTGALAFAVHGSPLTLPVTPANPVSTDPHATLAWSAGLIPELKMDLNWRSVFRHGGAEPFQMFFEGEGFVVVQPTEDPARFRLKGGRWLKALLKV
jgi:uncharacterized protein (AIM24 family)